MTAPEILGPIMPRTARRIDRNGIIFSGKLSADLALAFQKECERRSCEPAALVADILESVIKDDLYAAVLDVD